jgi:hypothetical protein
MFASDVERKRRSASKTPVWLLYVIRILILLPPLLVSLKAFVEFLVSVLR